MQLDPNEEKLLRSVALQNARSVLLARERAEAGLRETKEALERKTRELGEQREWYEVTLSSIGDAVITTDLQKQVTFLNPAAEAMTAWKSADAIGQPLETVFKIINERTRAPVENPITKALREGVVVGLENHTALIAKDGTETAIEDSAAPIRDTTGNIIGAVMVFHNVTRRRKAEEALKESESRKSAILNVSLDALITMDHEGKISDFNPAAEQIFGYSREAVVGRQLAELIIPERYRKQHYDGLARYLATGQGPVLGKRIEMPALHAKGHEFPTELSISRIAGIEPPIFTATLRDITERVLNQQKVRESEERYRDLFSSVSVALFVCDRNAVIQYYNGRAVELWGREPKCGEEKHCGSIKLFLPDGTLLPHSQSPMMEVLRTGISVNNVEVFIERPDGSRLPVLVNFAPVKNSRDETVGVVTAFDDITQRKRVEEALRRSEQELRALADSIPQLAWIAKADGHIFWYNRRWYEYTGTTLEQMEGWSWQSVHDPKMLPLVLERWKASINSGEPFEMEFPLRGTDGVFRWFLTRVNPVRDAEGRVVRWFGTNTDVDEVKRSREALQEETRVLELLNKTGTAIASQLNLESLVQTVTDAGRELSGAEFGAFFYNVINENGESLVLYTLSGAPREAFEKFGHPRATPVFAPTFKGEGVVRSDDITKDPRYGKMAPHHGMPKGHLPVRSYLAVPVVSRSGEVIGSLFFGHPEPKVFTERSERLISGVAAQAAIAIDNARLYETAQREIAERKRADAAVREGAERLQLALAAGRLGNWSWDAGTDILTLSDQAADILGLPRKTPITLTETRKLLPVEDAEHARITVEKALADHSAYTIEYRFTRPSGEQRWIIGKGIGTYAEDGSVTGLIGVIHDITEQKLAGLERERLISVLERSLNEIYIFDAEQFHFEYVNEGARRNLGYSMETMLQMTPIDLKPDFTEAGFREMVKPLLTGEKEKHVFYTVHRRSDGTLYPVEVHLQMVKHAGHPVFLAVINDITERQQAEEVRMRLAAVVESSDDAIISKTLEGIITTWNRGAELMYGYAAEEVIGKPVTLLIPANMRDEEPAIIERLKQGKKIDHYETVRIRKDGTLLDVALTVSPIRNISGKIIGASKIARDITARKRAERELRRAKDELEERVQERTASLTETTEQLESFCYTIAHDLRSPLRAQQSFAQVLLEDYKNQLDEEGRGYAQRIINSAKRLDQLVDDLLSYSRISRSELKLEKVELDEVLQNIQANLANEIRDQRATLSIDPLLAVSTYEPTLNIVITNLLTNALKFSKPGVPPKIHIWSEPKGDFVRLWVEDNGIGIDPQYQSKVFGVFERLHPMEKYPGTGIGLAIVQKGVERMGGRIGLESQAGAGSRFWIELPKG